MANTTGRVSCFPVIVNNCFDIEEENKTKHRHPCFSTTILLVYVALCLGWGILFIAINKEYQTSYPFSVVTSTLKLRGVLDTSNIDVTQLHPIFRNDSHIYLRVWDALDLIPSRGDASTKGLIIITNVAVTVNQTLSDDDGCPEDVDDPTFHCTVDSDCPKGQQRLKGHGIMTGRCVTSDVDETRKTCQIRGWCPVARNTKPLTSLKALLFGVQNLTVFLKSTVRSPALDVSLNNIKQLQNLNSELRPNLEKCLYDMTNPINQFCQRFRIGDIVNLAKPSDIENNLQKNSVSFDDVALHGGVFMLNVAYDCNLDEYELKDCQPNYSFKRVESHLKEMGTITLQPRHSRGE